MVGQWRLMVGMARRGAHSARHRAGRSQPDVRSHRARAADESGPDVDSHADPWSASEGQPGGPGPLGTAAFGAAGVGTFGPMGESEVGADGEGELAAGEPGSYAAREPQP